MKTIPELLPLARLAGVERQHLELFAAQGLQRSLYRRFDKAEYADAFVSGNIRLSTLEACRVLDSSRGGDPGEGSSAHSVPYMKIDRLTSPVSIGNSISFDASEESPMSDIVIEDLIESRRTRDTFLLCFSEHDVEPKCAHGERPYLVRVNDPLWLFLLLTRQVRKRHALRSTDVGPGYGFGRIVYRERITTGFDPAVRPGYSGWIKPKFPFEDEAEVRMIWQPAEGPGIVLAKEDLVIPQIPGLVERLS